MAMAFEISFVIFIVILALFIRQYFIRKKHPPGPLGFPFLGQFPIQIIQGIFGPQVPLKQYFKDMREKYGDIWSVDLGGSRMIVLASVELINEAFVDNAKLFSGRPISEIFKIICEDRGMIFNDGELAQENRQLAIKALRDLGMGRQILVGKICNEVDELIEILETNLSKPITSPKIFVKAVLNVINQLSFDERNKYDDPSMDRFLVSARAITHSGAGMQILDLFSKILDKKYLRKIFPSVEIFMKSNEDAIEFLSNKCRSRMEIEHEFSKPNCVFDYFWRYRYQDQPDVDLKEKLLNISHTIFDLLFGGTDTTSNLLSFSCLVLGKYPDIQKELRAEIQLHVDDYRLINMDMKKDLPKLLAFIDEMLRYSYLIPTLARRALKPCTFKGYKIEETDFIQGDITNTMRDPKVFENPDDFNLYRFMDESKTKHVPHKALIPFGMGKRACLGESIGKMQMFLFLSKIIQRFNISLPNEVKTKYHEIFEGAPGIAHSPLDHEIIFELINP